MVSNTPRREVMLSGVSLCGQLRQVRGELLLPGLGTRVLPELRLQLPEQGGVLPPRRGRHHLVLQHYHQYHYHHHHHPPYLHHLLSRQHRLEVGGDGALQLGPGLVQGAEAGLGTGSGLER